MQLQNTLEGGTDETIISTGNSGGASGDAFSSINIGAGNDFVYDNARAMHGSMSARMDLGSNPTTVDQIGWTFTDIAGESWGFFYIYLTGTWTGPSTMRICSFADGASAVGRIVLGRDTQVIQVSDADFAGAATTVAGVGFNDWYRIGWRVLHSATAGQLEASIYLGDSTTPITNGTCITDIARNTQTAVDTVTIGSTQGWVGDPFSMWFDSMNVNDEGNFGPFEEEEAASATFMPVKRRGG